MSRTGLPRIIGRVSEEKIQTQATPEEKCEICGAQMFGLHCKLICPNCGYRRDCSDP